MYNVKSKLQHLQKLKDALNGKRFKRTDEMTNLLEHNSL